MEEQAVQGTVSGAGPAEGVRLGSLRHSDLLRGLPVTVLEAVLRAGINRTLPDGARLYARGDAPDGFYGLVRGVVRMSSTSIDGREVVLTFMEAGTWFGEISLFDGEPRTHDAHAQGTIALFFIPRARFLHLIEEHPVLNRQLTLIHCKRLRALFSLVTDTTLHALPQRLASRLLQLADTYGVREVDGIRIALRLPQDELGMMVGASRQSVNREIKQWERLGLITQRKRGFVLRDPDGLARLAAGGALPET